MDKFDKDKENQTVPGQMGIDDISFSDNNMYDDSGKPSSKSFSVDADALKAYMEKKEKELQKNMSVVDKYFSDLNKAEKTQNSAFDGEVQTMKPKAKSAPKQKPVSFSGGGIDSGNGSDDGGDGYGGGKLYHTDLAHVMDESMMPYTEHVLLDRALPRVEDGLKPVQRRILYTMIELGLSPDKPYRKSAKVVGDCLGKYHPHGDSSVYDAMVRLAQPFLMRAPLVDGHGNFGSIDGDGAAASRYTEARLTALAVELVKDIEKDTVKFTLNFDDTLKEPETLPGKFPNLLVNGANGIAVGLTTSIPPHNAGEVIDGAVAYIDNPNISLKEMMGIIKGPDFPTGAYCLVDEDLENAYATGKGKVVMRAKVTIEPNGDKKNLVISEIPYQVNKAKLLQDIAELREAGKQGLLGGIADVVDESDRNGMRGVIKLKKDANAEKILAELYKKTALQCNFSINMVAVAGGKPEQLGLLKILKYFTDYQQQIILRRSKYDYEQAKERAHILTGLIVAIKNIDEVVKIIKKSKNTSDAKEALMKRFTLTEKQAQAILDMRLAKLTSLEIEKIEQELAFLEKQMKELQGIIASPKKQFEVVKKELLEMKAKFADERRTTLIYDLEDVSLSDDGVEEAKDVVVALSASGMIKKIPYKNFNLAQKEITDKTTENEIYTILAKTQTNKKAYLFTNKGNCHKLAVSDIVEAKWKEKGDFLKHILKDFADDEKVLYISFFDKEPESGELIFVTKDGMCKKSSFEEYFVNKYCFQTIKLKEGDEIVSIFKEDENKTFIMLTASGMALKISSSEVPSQGRISGGVKGISLADNDSVIAAFSSSDGELLAFSNFGVGKKVMCDQIDVMARARKGIKLLALSAREEIVFAGIVSDSEQIVYLAGGEILSKEVSKIETSAKGAKPASVIKLKRGSAIEKAWVYKN